MTSLPASNPYELHQHGGGFTVFESADAVALPLIQLAKATLRGTGGTRMIFEFSAAQVVVDGDGLTELYGHLLAGRVKAIRRGIHDGCTVTGIQISDI